MEAFLVEWGTEIILSLVIAILTYFFQKGDKEKDAQMKHYQELLEEERNGKMEKQIEIQLQPLWDELEQIRKKVLNLSDHHTIDVEALRDEQETGLAKLRNNLDLIISSYRYRLIELCRGLMAQGFMYQYQYEHLSEFFTLYTKLGGNGQAEAYYNKVCSSLEIRPNPADQPLT